VTTSSTGLALHESSYWELPEVREGSAFETAFVWMRSVPKNSNERNRKIVVVLHMMQILCSFLQLFED
jgi:hypothetical protein